MLTNFGFDSGFIKWISACISSVLFKILVNGGESDQFKHGSGLRQRDPLSSYLFILGQKVLLRMLDKELCSSNISSIKASARGPTVTHVMYADNIVLFSKATRKDVEILAKCLDRYCEWSGQSLNRGKSGIFFPNIPVCQVEEP